jgi:hypothetical protein
MYSDDEEDIKGNAEVIKSFIKDASKTNDIKKIRDLLKLIDSVADAIIEDIDRMAEGE